ncbi:hypothetical protein SAMN06297358_1515 [Pedobacter xixiisoli]|uniref:Uncharacterized protein n=1 Tax=Pedobacter xixiisoli TaxID=1476464 RepID=A0A285ZXH4_9SPHI|nr:hypothetical protein SAMN06297358_1515 [Pedobacter xixiisoli]
MIDEPGQGLERLLHSPRLTYASVRNDAPISVIPTAAEESLNFASSCWSGLCCELATARFAIPYPRKNGFVIHNY